MLTRDLLAVANFLVHTPCLGYTQLVFVNSDAVTIMSCTAASSFPLQHLGILYIHWSYKTPGHVLAVDT